MSVSDTLRRLSFRTKTTLSIITILLLLGIGLSVVISRDVSEALLRESKARGVSNALNVSARVAEPLLATDFLQMKNLVGEMLRTNDDVAYTFILDKAGEPVVHSFNGGFPVELKDVNPVQSSEPYHIRLLTTGAELIDDFAAPVLIGTDRIGTVRIGMSHAKIQHTVNSLLLTIVFSISFGILIVGLASAALANTVTKRIQTLHGAAEELVRNNFEVDATATSGRGSCWEFTGCTKTDCPAYGDTTRKCWYVVGTLCPTCYNGPYKKKIGTCRACPVYKATAGDEIQHLSEFFDVMALTLKDRLHELQHTEQSLRQQQRVLRTILDVTPDMVTLQDSSLRYQAVNMAFSRFVSKEFRDLIGKTDAEVFPETQAEERLAESRLVILTKQPLRAEKKVKGADGERWLHVIRTAVMNADGEVTGILCTSRDITEQKEMQERIVLSQRLESIGQLAAGVAHEINTPLGIILGYAQMMLEDAPPGTEAHENLRLIEKYARICRTIVADLLHFSRRTGASRQPVNVNTMIGQVVGVVEHTFGLERISIEQRLEPNLPAVFGDQEKLEQAFMNLLRNAHDAIGSDGTISISTHYDRRKGEIILSVADTGTGIPAEIKDRIFDPFFTTKGVGKGTGLGLSVTFGIVKDHGGRIEVESPYTIASQNGRPGSAFFIHLPEYAQSAGQGAPGPDAAG
ncbi:MAG TPA: ATP-binding protein [Nitrospirota bacterium]|nr:ATP-binding protein [Nitrospirota bacterium]